MNILIGYFAGKYGDKARVSIARITPRFGKVVGEIKDLAPSANLLTSYKAENCTWDDYVEEFNKMLDTLDKDEIMRQIEAFDAGNGVVLLCWEKDENHCHRKLVYDWLMRD